MSSVRIKTALISAFSKDGLEPIIHNLAKGGVRFVSTGGTQSFIESLGYPVASAESLTSFPAIFGGRVKTLHPAIFGGILSRKGSSEDHAEKVQHGIEDIDLVLVDLYPFEQTVNSQAPDKDIIEKIDIGGISLIRAAAKNYQRVLVVSDRTQYPLLEELLQKAGPTSTLEQRKHLASLAFETSSHYDTAIFKYFNTDRQVDVFKESIRKGTALRYGENPHQTGKFYGDLSEVVEQLHGKEISYNNLIDIDAAIGLMSEFQGQKTFAILKHNNACGLASANSIVEAYKKAFEADTQSAFGGVLIANAPIDFEAASEMDSLFYEVLIAPDFSYDALTILKGKKNRIILKQNSLPDNTLLFRSLINGVISQTKDNISSSENDFERATELEPTEDQLRAFVFANKIAKHTKSNAIVLSDSSQMFSSGVGQTSRVDAVVQAIEKANKFGFDLSTAVMASDAFFPFADSVEMAFKAGIRAVVQPGGSRKDQETIDFCNSNGIVMVFTGTRHFKH